jgi:hypothetical protein
MKENKEDSDVNPATFLLFAFSFTRAFADTDDRGSSDVCRHEQVPADWATWAGFPNPALVD